MADSLSLLQLLDERWDSGLTEYAFNLSRVLRSRGHRVFMASWEGTHAFHQAQKEKFPLHFLKTPLALRSFVQKENIEVVNAHTGSGHFWAFMACLGKGARALVRTRGDARPLRRNWGHRVLYAKTDALIAASPCIRREYEDLYPSLLDRLSVIYPGYTVAAPIPEPPEPLRTALVGRLDPVKGQEVFLEALGGIRSQLKGEKFIVAGEEKNVSLQSLRDKAQSLGLSEHVEFVGRLGDVGAFMRSCHLGVIASVGSEAVSRVCLEWMKEGRPLVSTSVGCLPELVEPGQNGFLVPARDSGALGQKILELLRDPSLRQRLGQRAWERASRDFSSDHFADQTERVYRQALQRKAAL